MAVNSEYKNLMNDVKKFKDIYVNWLKRIKKRPYSKSYQGPR